MAGSLRILLTVEMMTEAPGFTEVAFSFVFGTGFLLKCI